MLAHLVARLSPSLHVLFVSVVYELFYQRFADKTNEIQILLKLFYVANLIACTLYAPMKCTQRNITVMVAVHQKCNVSR